MKDIYTEVWNNLHIVEQDSDYINYQYKDLPIYLTICYSNEKRMFTENTCYMSSSIEDDFGFNDDTVEYYDLDKEQMAQAVLDFIVGTQEVKTVGDQLGITKTELYDVVDELAKEYGIDKSEKIPEA